MRARWIVAAAALAATIAAARAGDDGRAGATVALGRRLFFDPAASRSGRVACATCHDPDHGFGGSTSKSTDEDERETPRHAPSLVDLGDGPLGWDGEFDTLTEAIEDRLGDAASVREAAAARAVRRIEAANAAGRPLDRGLLIDEWRRLNESSTSSRTHGSQFGDDARRTPVAERLAQDGLFGPGFRAAFGDPAITTRRVVDALAAYVRSLKSSESPFDRLQAEESNGLSDAARRGFGLFVGKARCDACHPASAGGGPAVFTDGAFHDTGVEPARRLTNGTRLDAPGRARTTFVEADHGAFRTPGLRDVARRGPYFHDGSAATLTDVVRFYDRGGGAGSPGKALGLTDGEVADLVAFLQSLTGDVRPGAASLTPRVAVAVHVERLDGTPDSWVRIRVTLAGQPLGGAAPAAFDVNADENGDARFTFPAATHVLLSADDETLGLSRPIPDWTTSIALVATPPEKVSFRVRRPKSWAGDPARIELRTARTAGAVAALGSDKFVGRVCPDSSDRTLSADFVRALGSDDALYAMASPGLTGLSTRWVFAKGVDEPFDVDLTGGAANAVDLAQVEPADSSRLDSPSPQMRRFEELALGPRAGNRK